MLMCAIQLITAILFFANRFVPLALVLIGPVIVNILMFHLFLAPATIGPGVLVTVLWFIIFYYHRAAFEGIFQAKA